jgi:dTDP-4-amino-4,6-dideoxygalactose transaminase
MTFIGGFFGLELPPVAGRGLASFWDMPVNSAYTYVNGRSALAALLASLTPAKLWLPAYICRSVLQSAEATHTPVSYFPVDETLEPDTHFLDSAVKAGEMVLAVDYFGRAPNASFLDFVARRDDLLFVEDACHAFDTGVSRWGHWCLRSPRKLVGVPDGGFLIPVEGALERRTSTPQAASMNYQAACMRFEDEDEKAGARWHEINQSREASEHVSQGRMSRLSREVLTRLQSQPIADRRRENFRILAGKLEQIMFLPDRQPAFVPLGFPVRLREALRNQMRSDLIAKGIFPALHWIDLPSPPAFTVAHTLASELLTLPCDQRYQPSDMERLAQILMEMQYR